MDSDQSEELFSDDDSEENVRDSSVKLAEINPYSTHLNYSHFSYECSPSQQNFSNSAEIPTTPLSLIPHISKAQIWTSDLETPNAKDVKQISSPVNYDPVCQDNLINSQKVNHTTKTPVALDSPSSDEIVPGSQESSRKKKRKRPSRRILNNISNRFSDDDIYPDKNSQKSSHNEDSDFSNDKLSPIKEDLIEENLNEVERLHSKENKSFKTITPAERIKQLRERKKSDCLRKKLNVIDIPESEFVKEFQDLECHNQSFNLSQKNMYISTYDKVGLVPFSQIIEDNDEINKHLNEKIKEKDDEPMDFQINELVDDKIFRGFSFYSQENSNFICSRYNNFLSNKVDEYICSSTKYWKIMEGFCLDEIEYSTDIADKMSLKQWWSTASGKELFVNVSAVHQSESWLLEDDFCQHSIDILLPIDNEADVKNKLVNSMHENQQCCKTELEFIEKVSQLSVESINQGNIKNSCDLEVKEIDAINEDIESRKNTNYMFSEPSLSPFIPEPQQKDSTIKRALEDAQLMQSNSNAGNKDIFDHICGSDSVRKKAALHTENYTFIQPTLRKQVPSILEINNKHINDGRNKNSTHKLSLKREEINGEKQNNHLENIPINPPMIGFQTGRGKPIKVPEDALLKAQNMITEIEKDLNTANEFEIKDFELELPKLSKPTTSKPYCPNEQHNESIKNSKKSMLTDKDIVKNINEKSMDISMNSEFIKFQTDRNKSIKTSEDILSEAENIFTKKDLDLNELQIHSTETEVNAGYKKNNTVPETIVSSITAKSTDDFITPGKASTIPPLIGFQTGSGKNIRISENALLKAKTEMSKDMDENVNLEELKISNRSKYNPLVSVERSTISNNIDNFRKRRRDDDETPLGRKRARTGLDLQKRKLFEGIEEEDEALMQAVIEFDESHVNNDRNFSDINLQAVKAVDDTEVNCLNSSSVITDEVRDSVAAFLKEETNFNEIGDKWIDNEDNSSCTRKLLRSRTSVGSCSCPTEQEDKISEFRSVKRPRSYPGSSEPISVTVRDFKSPTKSLKHDSIPEELFFETQFSQDITTTYSAEQLQEQRSAAILEQERRILLKKRFKEKPVIGSLWSNKQTNDQISLKNYFDAPPSLSINQDLEKDIFNSLKSINSFTAENYQFNLNEFFGQVFVMNHAGGISLGDGAILIPNENNLAGSHEFKQSFLASPGVDPSLIPNGWVENHYKWIVWKLASMDRLRISRKLSGRFLTPDRVMKQLKYRYDREIDRSQRPALRRILEKDDVPSRRMVLCVSKVPEDNLGQENKSRTLELTDGWYSVPAIVDYAIMPYINSGKIREGTKLMIFGAELLNHEEGRYPLDISSNVRLKIHTNSMRRVKWDTKLGYQRQCGPMKTTLNAIKPNGGIIGKFTVAVARIYPLLFREKTSNGECIIRNARCEEKAAIAFEKECQLKMESMYFQAQQSTSKSQLEDNLRNNLPAKRNVTPILKIKIADNNCAATLSVWSCDEDMQSTFRENTCITIYNASVSGKKMNELQITAGRSTHFDIAPSDSVPTHYPRIFSSLEDVISPEFNPKYGEFDTIGIIVSIGPAPHGMRNFETVNIAYKKYDEEDSPSYYLSILFWEGVASYGFSEIATVGSFIACVNLEWRNRTYKSIPTAFCTEKTLLTRNPRPNYLRQEFDAFRARINDLPAYIESCATIIQAEVDKKSHKTTPSSRDSITSDRRSSNNWTPESRNHSLVNPDSITRSATKKMAIKNRLDRLSCYGDAPDLSPIHLTQTSRVSSDFRPPSAQLPKSSKME
ncbi:uncharacterized protein [Chelonus insularis]|uniref:uncharacterized protein isoform X2 n=1 Tax=Chelonus insularis TaxID=460826 RepID=UPI00158BC81E|nr:uncharacterized protein LOC118069482 isoform X2 [Chelonus insularis]